MEPANIPFSVGQLVKVTKINDCKLLYCIYTTTKPGMKNTAVQINKILFERLS